MHNWPIAPAINALETFYYLYREGRKGWLKLHIAVDADTGEINARFISVNNASDVDVLDELLSQIKEESRR